MTLQVTVRNRQRQTPVDLNWIEKTAEQLLLAVCRNLRQKKVKHFPAASIAELESRGIFSLTLVSNRQIKSLNKQWRHKNKETDVLSFPLELEPPPVGLPWEVGEIIISVGKAQEQAQEYGHSIQRELAFLFVHGALHILGFDHQTPAEEKEMFSRQSDILDYVGLTR